MERFLVLALLAGCSGAATGTDAATDADAQDAPLTPQERACRGLDIPSRLEPYDSCLSQGGGGGLIYCPDMRTPCARYRVHQDHPAVASCTIGCGRDADCPDNGICLRVMGQQFVATQLCFRSCANNGPCPPRTACRPAGLNSDPRPVCVPYEICTGTGFILPDGGV